MTTTIDASEALEHVRVFSTKPVSVLDVHLINTDTNELYLMIFDGTEEPSTGAVPKWRAVVPAGTQVSVSFNGADPHDYAGVIFQQGLVACLSTDPVSYTAAGDLGLFQAHWNVRLRGRKV